MRIAGKYTVVLKRGGVVRQVVETHNTIVDTGIARIVAWLKSDLYGPASFSGLRQIDASAASITNAGFTNANYAIDGNDTTYASALIDNAAWDSDWWKIDFGVAKEVMAIYMDAAEDDTSYGGDYKWQYSTDNSTWTDCSTRFRPPQEDTFRGKVLFYISPSPPFSSVSARYWRLNCRRYNDNDNFYFYEVRFYEPNFPAQPPAVMCIGTDDGTILPMSGDNTGLGAQTFIKKCVNATNPKSWIARFVMSMGADEGNSATPYKEAGMKFYSTNNHTMQTAANVDSLFSRAIFDTPWTKTSADTADVYFEVSITDAPFVP